MIIVEDDPDIAAMQQYALADRASVTLITSDFRRAFKAETWRGVDVAVVDLMLPGLNGEDICRYLAFAHPQVRRIICTARPTYDLPHLRLLAHVVLQKPFRIEDFVAAVMEEGGG